MPLTIRWFGHDSFSISDSIRIIYIDPWKLPPDAPKADVILVTHEHQDHCSLPDIHQLTKPNTHIVISPSCVPLVPQATVVIAPGEKKTIAGLQVEAVPAYNPKKKFHPNDGTRVGYIVTLDHQRIYHAGDTDVIPDMQNFHPDIAFLPISGTYVMTAEEAVEAVELLKPKQVIPMHFGTIIGTRADAERFSNLAGGLCQVTIPTIV